jgi:hypothetical protein
VFCPLQLNSEILGVPEDSQVPILGVWVSSSHSLKVGLRQVHLEGHPSNYLITSDKYNIYHILFTKG